MDVSSLKSNWDLKIESDQQKGIEIPPFSKPAAPDSRQVALPGPDFAAMRGTDLVDAILSRRSNRKFTAASLSLSELAWLLYATQGVREPTPRGARRTAPSAGARHPFETYVAAIDVDDLAPGLYHYLAYDHRLELLRPAADRAALREEAQEALNSQGWGAPALFFWTAVPYRTHWRYPGRMPKLVALDAGHLCQNLYLACEAVGAGTCAIGAYDQAKCDAFLGVDGATGVDRGTELTVYAAPVGKV